MKKTLIFAGAFALAIFSTGCAKKNMHYYAKKAGLDFGFAVTSADLLEEAKMAIVRENAAMIVSENNMKNANIHPTKRFWNWSDTDHLIEFAKENDIDVKFHTLFWHQQNAPFIMNLGSREEALAAMDEHIEKITEHYKGKIKVYDVVNEMFEEDGSFRKSVWFNQLGPEYLEHALRKTHECDPDAKLYLNEYNNENMGYAKSDSMYNLVKDFKARGVPIDGVGMQLHLDGTQPLNEEALLANIRRYAELGIEISFSEVDVRIPTGEAEKWQEAQKNVFCTLLKIALEEPNVKSYIMWGYSDNGSWVPGTFPGYGYALPFDKDRKPKPVYNAMLEIMKSYKKSK